MNNKQQEQTLAIEALKKIIAKPAAKFHESIDIAINLNNSDIKKSKNVIRGTIILPHGNGKKITVAAIVEGDDADIAKKAGADAVGTDTIIDDILKGKINYQKYITTTNMIASVAKVAKILGPKNLMPSAKSETIVNSNSIAESITNIKQGKKIDYRADKNGVIHICIGNITFTPEKLLDNLKLTLSNIYETSLANGYKHYFKSVYISSTMGKSFSINLNELSN